MQKIRIGIVGYGNLGKGVEVGIKQNEDMELIGIFTRREPSKVKLNFSDSKAYYIEDAIKMKDEIDVMILCGGSATDIPKQGPDFAQMFNTVDGFDTHKKISEYFKEMDKATRIANKVSIISTGWDPGMFSLNRLISESILPEGETYTFWGEGISQGHSDAIRRVKGVKDGVQYTIPKIDAVNKALSGENPVLETKDKHKRLCYIVLEFGADKDEVKNSIINMPNYFADYETEVLFITEDELNKNHQGLPHGGRVIRSGLTGSNKENKQVIEYKIKLDSNPEFTANILLAYARAAYRLNKEGKTGAMTLFDIAPAYLSILSPERLRETLL